MTPAGAPEPPTLAVRVTTVLAVLLVATVAAVVSYAHMQTVAARSGEDWRSWLIPLSIDGLIVAASMVLLTRSRSGLPGGWLPWTALLAAVGASLAANVAAADPTVTARVVALWPPLAFAAAFELLLQQRRPVGDRATSLEHQAALAVSPAPATSPAPAPVASPTPAWSPVDPPVARQVSRQPERQVHRQPGRQVNRQPGRQVNRRRGRQPDLAKLVERARPLVADGAGRTALARQLQVSEHQARRILDELDKPRRLAAVGN